MITTVCVPISKDLDLHKILCDWVIAASRTIGLRGLPSNLEVKEWVSTPGKTRDAGAIEFRSCSEGEYSITLEGRVDVSVYTAEGSEVCKGYSICMVGALWPSKFWATLQEDMFRYLLARFGGYYTECSGAKTTYNKIDRAKKGMRMICVPEQGFDRLLGLIDEWMITQEVFRGYSVQESSETVRGVCSNTICFKTMRKNEMLYLAEWPDARMPTPQGYAIAKGKNLRISGYSTDGSIARLLEFLIAKLGGYYSEDSSGAYSVFRQHSEETA